MRRSADCAGDLNPLDALLADAVSNADPVLRERAYQKLIQRGHLIARRLMGDGVRSTTESMDICLSVMRDLSYRIEQSKVSFADVPSLVAYLRRAINNKIAEKARYGDAAKRRGCTISIGSDGAAGEYEPLVAGGGAELCIRERELLRAHSDAAIQTKEALRPDHRLVVELREANPQLSWDEITLLVNAELQAEAALSIDHCRQIYSRYMKSVRSALDGFSNTGSMPINHGAG